MNTDNKEVYAIIFERKVESDDNEKTIYSYTPMEVTDGLEVDIEGIKLFISRHVQSLRNVNNDNINEEIDAYEFPIMKEDACLSDNYVYAFPLIINEKDKDNLSNIKKEMISLIKDAKKYKIHHIVKKDKSLNKMFLDCNGMEIEIDGSDYYELYDLLYSDTLEALAPLTRKEQKSEPYYKLVLPTDFIYSDDIFDTVSKTVICQDDQIKQVATAIAKNSRLESPSLKSTILLCGPTGVGKTEIFRCIRDNFDVPIAFEDANEYTAASYKGKDTIEMLVHLLEDASGDIEKAQRGILVIDEIDKKVSHGGVDHDTYTSAVINSFLKMMEGHVYNIPVGKNNEIEFDTSQLTFAFLGAFSGIEEYSSKKKSMGFVTEEAAIEASLMKNIYNEDTLKKYGLLPEFVGRCDTIVTMNNLDTDDFIKIIKTSNKSQLLLYKYLLKDIGIDFIYDEKTIEAIAKKASELGLGARSIKKIVENALSIANYQLFARNQYSKLIISPETIEDNKSFILR